MSTPQGRVGRSKYPSSDEKRRGSRQKTYADIWVDPGDVANPVFCRVLDISHEGARLSVQDHAILPDTFHMRMGSSRHAAKVMWRSGQQIGVEFQKPTTAPEKQWRRYSPAVAPADAGWLIAPPAPAPEPNGHDPLNSALRHLGRCLEALKD